MPRSPALVHSVRILSAVVATLVALSFAQSDAATVTVPLDAVADLTSNFNTYWSEGIAQLNLTYASTKRQPFWNTNNLSQTYNASFDFFPNDRAMKFGVLTYDDASLSGGSGSATITGLTLGIEKNPLDPSYINGTWLSFTTDLQAYSGAVTVFNGTVTAINLTANYTTLGYFGAAPISGIGQFTIAGDKFRVAASGYEPSLGDFNPTVAWDWTGVISAVTPMLFADFDDNDLVDGADLALWRGGMGVASGATLSQGDADRDGDVDGADFLLWQRENGTSLGQVVAAAGAVPEPNAALILAVAVVGCSFRSRAARGR